MENQIQEEILFSDYSKRYYILGNKVDIFEISDELIVAEVDDEYFYLDKNKNNLDDIIVFYSKTFDKHFDDEMIEIIHKYNSESGAFE